LPGDATSCFAFVKFVLDNILHGGLWLRASFVHDVCRFACQCVRESTCVLALFHVFETGKRIPFALEGHSFQIFYPGHCVFALLGKKNPFFSTWRSDGHILAANVIVAVQQVLVNTFPE
jgi:hypothetical protein